MNVFSIVFDAVAHLANGSTGPVLIAKWTLLLALAWLAHAALAGRNPRWRVALWRGAMLGITTIAVLAMAPPIVSVPIVPAGPRRVVERAEQPGAALRVEPAPPAVVVSPPESPSTMQRIAIAPVARAEHSPDLAARPRPAEPVPPAESWPSRAIGLAQSWAPSIWLAGLIILTARLILASLALDRLVRRSSEAPEGIARECRAIAEHMGCTRTVRVIRSPEVATPCLVGIVRPVLLLPDREGQDDLPAILAHELAHARHHDLAWNLASHLATIALWFHPLAWRIRSVHAAACDAVSDAVAADFLGDVASYGRALARLAVRAARPAPAHVLAMARTSDVRRRLDALNRQVFRTPLSWRFIMPALLVGGMLLVLIGGVGFTRTEAADDPPAPQDSGKLTLRAVAATTDRPIEGVSIEYRGRIDGKDRKGTAATGKDGLAKIEYPPGVPIESFEITARKAGFAPICFVWDNERHPVAMPPSKNLRFEPGTTIGGIVQDEAGHPIAGARVDAMGPPTECENMNRVFTIGTAETDARGRWSLDVAPKDLRDVSVHATHPRYIRRPGESAWRVLDGAIVLTRGLAVTGRVVDAGGRPVKGRGSSSATTSAFPSRSGRRTIAARSPWRIARLARQPPPSRPRATRPGSRTCRSRDRPSPRSSRSRSAPRPFTAGSSTSKVNRSPAPSSAPTPGESGVRSHSGPPPARTAGSNGVAPPMTSSSTTSSSSATCRADRSR